MLKKLTAKVQQLNPNLEESTTGFSHSFIIEPESQDLLLKKGSLYVVFDISGNTRFEVSLISKVVHDMLHDSYYQSESISPIQSLEKAITEVRDRVVQLANESIIIEKQEIEFNMVAGALWGNVMYVVQYGDSKSFLMRIGEIRPISTNSEGNFSAASGVVKDEDVIIFCSNEFSKDFPPDRLLTVSIPESSLKNIQSCLLMKFIIDTTFTQNEIVDFEGENIKMRKESPKLVGVLIEKFNAIKTKKQVKVRQEKNQKPVSEIGIRLKPQNRIKFKTQYVIPLALLALGISVFFTLKNRKSTVPIVSQDTAVIVPQADQVIQPTQEEKPDTTALYDMKLTDINIQPSEIVVFTDFIVVTDKTAGKFYISERETPKFTVSKEVYPEISNAMNIKGQLGFTDNTGYKVIKVSDETITENYKTSVLDITSAYSDFIYSINSDKLNRYSKGTSTLTESLWAQNAELAEVKSFGISYSIFMLKNDGTVAKYTTGEKDTFKISNGTENVVFNNPTQLLADVDFDYVYVADAGNQRVVSFDKNGKMIKEYKATEEGKWADIKSIGISPDEKTLYVLAGTRIYETSL